MFKQAVLIVIAATLITTLVIGYMSFQALIQPPVIVMALEQQRSSFSNQSEIIVAQTPLRDLWLSN